eukprot:4776496-Pleurochrysis_carterae.AAC.1
MCIPVQDHVYACKGFCVVLSMCRDVPAQAGYTEPQIARRCICCATLALSVFGVAWEAWMLYPAMCMLGIAPGGFATVSSLASQVVPPAVVGEAQANALLARVRVGA